MDPASALTGKTQISVHCSQCNFTITKWVNQVKNVDSSVTVFKEELLSLQLTFDKLSSGLKDDALLDTARITDQHAGGNLWSQVSTTLNDCQTTILSLKQGLENIEFGSRRISSMLKHLAEHLNVGELVFMRDTVKLLDQNIAFPMTMINITILLQRPDLKHSSSKFVVRELAGLKSEHDGFASRVQTLLRSTKTNDNRVLLHMQDFSSVVDEFLTNTASILNSSSTANAVPTPYDIPPQHLVYQAGDEFQVPLPDDNATIRTFETYEELDAGTATMRSSNSTPTPEEPVELEDSGSENENEIELELTLEYMANGQADLEIDDYAGAEENFRRALEMAEENDFSDRLDYGPGDITLMLADCLMKQEKEEEALELLEPIADGTAPFAKVDDTASRTGTIKENPESGLQYKANHILGVVFLKRLDYAVAEKRAKQAFKGRRRLLGAQDPMTLESVQLIIDIYTAKDDRVSARAYKRFLEPPTRHASRQSTASVKTPTSVLSPRIKPAKSPSSASQRTAASAAIASPADTVNIQHEKPPPSRASTVASTATRSIADTPAPLQPKKVVQSPPIQSSSVQSPLTQASTSQAPQLPLFPQVYNAVTNGSQSPPPSVVSRSPPPTISSFAQSQTQISPPTSNRNSNTFSSQGRLGNIIEEQSTLVSPIDAKVPVRESSISAPTAKVEPDPLPPNFGPVTANTRKKMNWTIPFKPGTNRPETKSETSVFPSWNKFYTESGSRDQSRNSSMTGLNLLLDAKRQMSLASNLFDTKSFMSKINDYTDDKDGRASIASRSYSMSTHPPARTRQELAPRFQAITSLRIEGKRSASIDTAMKLLREYDPDRKVLMVREGELKKNMKEGHRGLAATGYGYAAIHFFCERKIEANIEVELLVEGGADVNAVASKAGMPGTDPFTPLQRAIEMGHAEIVRILIGANVAIAPPQPLKDAGHNLGSKDAITHPLLIACQQGQTQITWLLLIAGGAKTLKEFPQRQWHGKSLLHEACWLANVEMVKMLLDYTKILHQQEKSQTRDNEVSVIGSPGLQDQFGATPIMYAIDVRDCTSYKSRALKIKNRKECLKLLLEHDVHGDLNTQTYRESVARMLSLKWTRGPGNGHSIFCYADESGDEELIRILDPFRYQVSPGLRCSATPQCSATLRSESVHISSTLSGGKNARMQTVRLPSFPELMSTPLNFPSEVEADSDMPPPSFESAVRATSPTIGGGTVSGGSDLGTTLSS